MEVIRSLNNNKIRTWSKYHEKKYREKDQRFLVENQHLIQEALDADLVENLILLEDQPLIFDYHKEITLVSVEVMKKLKMNPSLPNYMAVVRMPPINPQLGNKIILCDNIQDPGNIGTMIRSAYSFGFDSFIVSKNSVDLFNEKVIRSTQGALFHMNVLRCNLEEVIDSLKKEHYSIYATSLHDAKELSHYKCPKKLALVFGNEGSGVSDKILSMSDEKIYIEMNQFESLNVAVACGICCYWFKN